MIRHTSKVKENAYVELRRTRRQDFRVCYKMRFKVRFELHLELRTLELRNPREEPEAERPRARGFILRLRLSQSARAALRLTVQWHEG